MPLHDYHCTACGADFELLVRADTRIACPACGGAAPERLVSLPAAAGRSGKVIAAARRAAAREGHFSHYGAAERARIK